MTIREYLKNNRLITDGSFGTYYAEKYATQEMPELANILHPERVEQIHASYIEAGARLIRTNTFATNALRMDSGIEENIRAAIRLARHAIEKSGREVFLAGDIGPIPLDGQMTEEELEAQYRSIVDIFLDEGIEIITFETFAELEHIKGVTDYIRSRSDAYIMVQFSIDQFGYSVAGLSAKKLLEQAAALSQIDAIGLNCGVGPGHMTQIFEKIALQTDKQLIALPNAGYPKRIRNTLQFSNNSSYFSMKVKELAESGVDIVGGCCGTNPAYIQQLSELLDVAGKVKHASRESIKVAPPLKQQTGFFYHSDGTLKKEKLIAVELAPPVNADDEKLLEAAHILQRSNVDVLTFPDSPSGRTRIDSVLMAEKVQRETGLTVMPHICCRDKNAIAMRSMFLGAHINDINNMLIITGDPIPSMVRQSVKSVFNFDSVGLMNIIKDMNEEMFTEKPVTYGGAINQGRRNLDVEINRVKKKMEAGAQFFLTQPVFTKEDADRVRNIKEQTGARILCGIMPLINRKNALFMKNEIVGVMVTDEIVNRYPEQGSREEGEAVGVAIAREIMAYTENFADGYYFSFPFNRVYLLEQILR